MAELILSPILNVVMEMLGSATVEKLESLWGVKDDLEDLKESVSSIQAVLLDAEEKQSHNNQVRLWLQRLEDVVTDVDDLFDEVASEGLRRQLMPTTTRMKKVRTFFSSSNQISFRYKMAKEIWNVKRKMAKIAADRIKYQLVESRYESVRPVGSGRETCSFVVEENVVGRVGDKREVLELVFSPESRIGQERVSVLPIVGMGGLGKTTLAQLVFNDVMVKDHFEPRIWVCVSDDFDERTIVGKIVEKLITHTFTKDDTLEKLQKMLLEGTNGKRYFLVLDDVWSEDWHKWQNVKDLLLNCGKSGSTILVTTRSERVAKLSSEVRPYRLGILDEDDSWSLFKKIAFKQGKEPAEAGVVEVGKEIVKKCGGIPLAIRMTAGMLSQLDPKTSWSCFLNKELSSVTQKDGDILLTLRLSYNCLPPNLKHCFAYCSLFPKDYIFDAETLVNLWIAQGFIGAPSDGSQSLEDVGYDYFLELVSRSFFQELEIVLDKVVRCKMHDLVHDLAIQVGGEKYARLEHGSKPNALEKAHHVSLGWRESIPSLLLQAKKLRSFIRPCAHPGTHLFIESEFHGEMALEFSLLRTLDLHKSQISEVPISVVKLKHLRYLDLSENVNITRLPDSIIMLVNLQTLKLTDCMNLCELPTGIGKLVNLRHLTWSNDKLILPRGVSQLTNLRTLSCFTLSGGPTRMKLDELSGLNNLRGHLEIKEIRSGLQVERAILKEKKHLQSLSLCWSVPDSDVADPQEAEKTLEGLQPNQTLKALTVDGYDGIRFSNWILSLANLVELRLVHCLNLKQLPSLESLCALRKLYVVSCKEMKYIETDVNGEGALDLAPLIPVFSSLQHMQLAWLPSFKGWKRSNIRDNEDEEVQLLSYFPHLTSLEVINCPKLISMPLYPYVKELKLEKTNPNLFEQTISAYMARPQISQTTDSSSPLPSLTSSFHPLVKVTKLRLYCQNRTDVEYLPDWMQSFSCLETLEINGFQSYSFSYNCGHMTWVIEEDDECEMSVGGNQTSWEIYSGIRKLILVEVPILKHVSLAAQYFPSLETLQISTKEDLDFSWEGLPDLHKEISSRLKILCISRCKNLSAIPNWIWKLSSLQQLEISSCQKLESMPASLSSLNSLQTLNIWECPILTLDDEIKWEALVSLHSLDFFRLPKLVSLPDGLQHATTLKTLKLKFCRNLSAIPDWICNLSSLQLLEIYMCRKIESLPRSIKSLTSLQTLKISGCPSLSKRCQRQMGEDWPNICHIPNIEISG